EIREDYEATVGSDVNFIREHSDTLHGDPAKAAQVILRIASEKEPPLRLLLGSDAVFLAGVAAAKRAEEDAKWKPLSLSTDFDGLPDFAETPFGRMLASKRS